MKTVLCHGVFDVLHAGHLAYFQAAKKFGDRLIVSVTKDEFVNKGPGRPYFTTEKRASMLAALSVVDQVIISEDASAVGVINAIKPAFYVKGNDYKDLSKDVTGEIYNEKTAVEQHGGCLVFTDEDTFSSSTLINKFFHNWSDEQKSMIETVQSLGGMDAIEKAIKEIGRLNVLVIGEPIKDIYRFCTPEGISSKSPTVSARFNYEETYLGGSWAIGAHLKSFAKEMTLQHHAPVAQKIRYISGTQRIFEVTHIDDQHWKTHNSEYFCDKIQDLAKQNDVVVVADFGHGLFEGEVLNAVSNISTFIGLNCQSNSSNFGYNVATKHTRFDYLCLDTREVRLATHDRYSPPMELARQMKMFHANGKTLGLTVGSNGAYLLDQNCEFFSPAFADVIVDLVGAGDAFFALTTCLLKTNCRRELIPFIGCVFAALKARIIGNKTAVSRAALLKSCTSILK